MTTRRLFTPIAAKCLLVIILAGLCFFGGMHYQKGHDHEALKKYQAQLAIKRTLSGKVTSVSEKEITIENPLTHSQETYVITKNTVIQKSGKDMDLEEIQQNKIVLITLNENQPNQASHISLLSPTKSLVPAAPKPR